MELEKKIRDNYRCVLLKTPHQMMDLPFARELFARMVDLKTKGYQEEYGQNVLPFDACDFIASHVLMCEVSNNQLVPVLGFKSVTLELCDRYCIPFPMLGMLESNHPNQEYKDVILKKMAEYREMGKTNKLGYNGSFTILPRLRQDKVLMKHLWDVTFSMINNYYIESEIDHVVAICATKFNIHKKKEQLGWNVIAGPQGDLAAYGCRSLFGASLLPMELTDVKTKGSAAAEKFKDMWENKIVLEKTEIPLKKVA